MPENNEQENIVKPKQKKVKKKVITLQERRFLKGIERGETPAIAAENADYSKSYSKNANQTIMEKPVIKEAIGRLMDRQGLSDSKLLQSLAEGLLCTKMVESDSEIIEVPDHSNRRHYLNMALNLKALYPSKEVKIEHTSKTLEELLKEIKGRGIERDITPPHPLLEEDDTEKPNDSNGLEG